MIGTSKLIDAIAELDASCAKLEAELATANAENKRLRDRVQEASRIVEKYKDACMEWAKEAHHRGNRDDKIFWERRAKSIAVLIEDIKKALKGE